MNKRDRLRQKKEKRRRERRQARRQQEDRHIDNIIQYPQFIIEEPDPEIVPKELVEGIRLAVQAIKFNNRKQFSAEEAQMFKLIKQVGFRQAMAPYRHESDEFRTQLSYFMFMKPGVLLFDMLKACGDDFYQFIPYCNIRLIPAKDIHVRFDALLRAKGPYGTIFYSRHRPTIEIGGRSFIVGYSRHAMDRVAERATKDPHSFGGAMEAFSYLSNQTRFRMTTLRGDTQPQVAIEFVELCKKGCFTGVYAEQITGAVSEFDNQYFRLGYAILSCTGPYAVAKTFLAPGMRGTPEYEAVMNSGLGVDERRNMLTTLEQTFTYAGMLKHKDFSAQRWVHEHGVPQVFERNLNPFGGEAEQQQSDEELLKVCIQLH